ncbi:MAG: hypothetical protein KC431_16940, partial [Myxococcales bacterium]|nr:hypothetical protein [Myxococcales bacterium]
WSYRPELRPDELMQIIYDSGWDTGRLADFALAGSPTAHRLSVCAALSQACDGQSGDCPTPVCAAAAPAADGNLTGFAAAVTAVLDDPSTNVENFVDLSVGAAPVCSVEEEGTDLASPQPDVPICSRCNLPKKDPDDDDADDQLVLTIAPPFAGLITGITLVTTDEIGAPTVLLLNPLVIASVNAQPHPVDVTRVAINVPDAVAASLVFQLVDGSTQTNQITVIEHANSGQGQGQGQG